MMKRGREATSMDDAFAHKRQAGLAQNHGGAQFVEAVKSGQRASGNFKQAWYNYCERNGTNVFDPAKHEHQFLGSFFDQLGTAFLNYDGAPAANFGFGGMMPHMGARHQVQQPRARMMPGGGARNDCNNNKGPSFTKLVEMLKQGQRNDASWKELWIEWCSQNGRSVQDPSKHQPIFIIAFILKFGIAQVVEAEWAAPYLVALGEVAKPHLVTTIKRGQGMSSVWKDSWSSFAETASQNANMKMTARDPARHDAGTLMEFFDTIAMPEFSEEPWMEMWKTGSEEAEDDMVDDAA